MTSTMAGARDGVTYLDYAATAAVRPDEVTAAIVDFLQHVGATPGRGGHRLSVQADRIALRCRQSIARLLDIPGDPGRIAFLPNATYALNAALHGVVRERDHVVTTVFDHNAVLRPVAALERRGVSVTMVRGDASGALDMDGYTHAVRGARIVVLNAASNVLGTALDLAALSAIAHDAGALVLVDAAQAAGEIPFSVATSGADMVALTGHKGLLGPQGTGALWARTGLEIEPLVTGGTGGDSMARGMPAAWPDHLEAGTSNGVGIAGLAAGVDWLLQRDVGRLHAQMLHLASSLHDALAATPTVRVLSPRPDAAPIVTFVSDALDPSRLAARLDREHGVLGRPGHHCAPEVHRLLGTERAGALRLSIGWATTESDIARAGAAVAAVVGSPAREEI